MALSDFEKMASSEAQQHPVAAAETDTTFHKLSGAATTSPEESNHGSTQNKEKQAHRGPASFEASAEAAVVNNSSRWRAWSVVLGSMFLTIPTYGLMSALGLFQLYWQNNQLSTIPAPTVSWIISIFGFLTCFLDFPVGLVFDHWGTNVLLPVGCVLYWASFLSLAWASTYAHFFACFVAAGISASIPTVVAFCVIDHWFTGHRAVAMGAVTAGAPIGGIFFSLLLRKLFATFDWQRSMYIVSSTIGFFLGLGMLMVRSKPQPRTQLSWSFGHFKSLSFVLFTFAVFYLELVLYTQWGSLPLFAADLKLGDAFYLQVVYNVGAICGRTVPSYFADSLGVFNMLHSMIGFTAVTVFAIWIPFGAQHAAALYVVGFLMGVGTGSFVPLSATCLSRLCDDRGYGKWLGSCYSVVSLGTLIANPINQILLASGGGPANKQEIGPRLSVAFQGILLVAALIASLIVRWRHIGH